MAVNKEKKLHSGLPKVTQSAGSLQQMRVKREKTLKIVQELLGWNPCINLEAQFVEVLTLLLGMTMLMLAHVSNRATTIKVDPVRT